MSTRIDITVPSVDAEHILYFTGRPLQATREAMATGAFSDDGFASTLPYDAGLVQLRPPGAAPTYRTPDEQAALREQLQQHAAALCDEDVDHLDVLLSRLLPAFRTGGSEASITITPDDLLRGRGLAPKLGGSGTRGGFRPKERRRALESLQRLGYLHIQADAATGDNTRTQRERIDGPLLQIRCSQGTPREAVVRLGGGATALLAGSPPYTLLPRQVLRYHAANNVIEKRLARYLAFLWRVNARKGASATVSLSHIVDKAGAAERLEKRPGRVFQRIEDVLNRLRDDGIIGQWAYDGGSNGSRQKGWVQQWLQSTITTCPPPDIAEKLTSIHRRERGRKPS